MVWGWSDMVWWWSVGLLGEFSSGGARERERESAYFGREVVDIYLYPHFKIWGLCLFLGRLSELFIAQLPWLNAVCMTLQWFTYIMMNINQHPSSWWVNNLRLATVVIWVLDKWIASYVTLIRHGQKQWHSHRTIACLIKWFISDFSIMVIPQGVWCVLGMLFA